MIINYLLIIYFEKIIKFMVFFSNSMNFVEQLTLIIFLLFMNFIIGFQKKKRNKFHLKIESKTSFLFHLGIGFLYVNIFFFIFLLLNINICQRIDLREVKLLILSIWDINNSIKIGMNLFLGISIYHLYNFLHFATKDYILRLYLLLNLSKKVVVFLENNCQFITFYYFIRFLEVLLWGAHAKYQPLKRIILFYIFYFLPYLLFGFCLLWDWSKESQIQTIYYILPYLYLYETWIKLSIFLLNKFYFIEKSLCFIIYKNYLNRWVEAPDLPEENYLNLTKEKQKLYKKYMDQRCTQTGFKRWKGYGEEFEKIIDPQDLIKLEELIAILK